MKRAPTTAAAFVVHVKAQQLKRRLRHWAGAGQDHCNREQPNEVCTSRVQVASQPPRAPPIRTEGAVHERYNPGPQPVYFALRQLRRRAGRRPVHRSVTGVTGVAGAGGWWCACWRRRRPSSRVRSGRSCGCRRAHRLPQLLQGPLTTGPNHVLVRRVRVTELVDGAVGEVGEQVADVAHFVSEEGDIVNGTADVVPFCVLHVLFGAKSCQPVAVNVRTEGEH